MSEIKFNSRIIHKHDTETNWNNAVNFIPMNGEIIVYDPDENYNYSRLKIGDGTTTVTNLPFELDMIVLKMVGEKTTGKGYFQSTFELDDGSAVGISIGKYTTPNGVSLADVGITPEICVEVDEETAYRIYAGTLDPAEDPQIQAAVEALKAAE